MANNKFILVLFVFAGVFVVGYTDCKLQLLVIHGHLNSYYCNTYFQLQLSTGNEAKPASIILCL